MRLAFNNFMNIGFKPVFNSKSRVLILGSFPSTISRKHGFYYGNKQNRFWKTLSEIFNEEITDSIDFKTNFVLKHGIALFDIVSESDVSGSSDANLARSNNKVSDISFLLPPNTDVEKIICNGKTSYEILTKNLNLDIPVVYLPSTSPANPRFSFEVWQSELKFLLDN